jgi:hypothetical protein
MAATPLSEALLKDKSGKEVKASTLWADQPALVVVLRRPGCCEWAAAQLSWGPAAFDPRPIQPVLPASAVLCRDEAIKVWNDRAAYEQLGVRLACVLHEWKEREVEAFAPEYWGGELYLDEAKAFYAAVHGGAVKRGNLLDLVNPFGR